MLTRYEPWNALRQMHDEMNRVFGQVPARSDDGSEVFATGWVPAVDVKEEEQRFLITADVGSSVEEENETNNFATGQCIVID